MPAPAAPPAAPPPAPAKPAAASPAPPPPIPAGEKPASDYLGDITGELADMDAASPNPIAPKPRRDERGQFQPADKSKMAPEAKLDTKPDPQVSEGSDTSQVKPEDPPGSSELPKPVRAAELRTAYEGLKKKVAEDLQPTIQQLQAKIKEYETKVPEASGPILAKIKTLEERNQALEQRMTLVDYEQSQDYQTKYEVPYREMWNRATNAFGQLAVKEQAGTDPETGQSTYKTRPATEADLLKLGALPLSELDEVAQTMFGPSAPRAVQYIEKLRELAEAKQTAIVDATKKAGEWKSQRELESNSQQQARETAWQEINKGLEEKFPKAFKADEADADDVASHAKGFALANLLFAPATLTPAQIEALPPAFRDTVKANKPLTDAQKVQLHALSRLKIANHDRQVARAKKLVARVAELEKTLSEYEQSEPSTSRASGSPGAVTKPWDEQVADELAAMDRKA